jgi:large subunit ribosomal protein L3
MGMTQVFRTFGCFSSVFDASFEGVEAFFEAGTSAPVPVPVTVVKIELCQVIQIKLETKEGYNAVQIAYGYNKLNKRTKPMEGYFKHAWFVLEAKKLNLISSLLRGCFKRFCEFRLSNPENYKPGQIIKLDDLLGELSLNKTKTVQVTGQSIGKGFAGNQKRHKFKRGPMTHGSKNHRAPGSIGAGSTPGRVYPGKKMSGQLGNKRVMVKTEIIYANTESNILVLKGSLPGKTGNLLKIEAIPKNNFEAHKIKLSVKMG